MTDKTDSKERDADALIRKLRDVLDECRSYIDTPTLSPLMDSEAAIAVEEADIYLAGRASLAASAGSEPVAEVMFADGKKYIQYTMPKELLPVGTKLYTHHSLPGGMVGGWISVEDRLPEWAARDDTPCFINGKEVPPTLTSETVLVALKGGGVRTDKLTTIEGKSDGWWHTYGERVVAWQKTPAPPASEAKGA